MLVGRASGKCERVSRLASRNPQLIKCVHLSMKPHQASTKPMCSYQAAALIPHSSLPLGLGLLLLLARPDETERALFSEVLSNCDVVECILASFGANAPKAGRVSRLWLEAAQRVLARCRVVELEASTGELWCTDDDDVEGGDAPERRGLRVNCHAGYAVATPTGMLLSDCNNGRILVLDPTGQPTRAIEGFCYPNDITCGFDSIYVRVLQNGLDEVMRRISLSGEDRLLPSSPSGVRTLAVVGESLFVGVLETENVSIVLEYEAATASFVREFCRAPARYILKFAGLGESLLMLENPMDESDKESHVSTHSLATAKLWARCAVPDSALSIAAQNDRLFVATARLRQERGALHVMLLDGTPLQRLEVHAAGGPRDLCIAHGKLYCICEVDYSEEDLYFPGEDEDEEEDLETITQFGDEMHALCVYRFVGAQQHF